MKRECLVQKITIRLQRYNFFLTYANIFVKKNIFYSQYCIYHFFFVILQSLFRDNEISRCRGNEDILKITILWTF